MDLKKIIKQSLSLPKKEAVFFLNRVSMRDTLVYLFALLFLVFLPEGIQSLLADNLSQSERASSYILQMIVFYPIYIIFLSLIGISALAASGLLIVKVGKRKLAYQHLWKMTSFALTVPLILNMIVSFIGLDYWLIRLLILLMFYLILYKMVMVYPRNKNKG
ncbi:DUF1189 domain-containing protein [Aquibacillus halophilus]|uniref:DUF1189 domain-containing protein n=1 Tax=Aquibacillus halophilus TaxID=930132 RepID=A0A6A8DD03_9BACI|nr:DUF1189 family protein [Aquibacillus halophilus]MRH41759.1 DUF1189 domain-containing protein [Aquibacillus halophilus]